MAKKIGRPTSVTQDVIRKLEEAFSFGVSDKEACCFADIAPSTLYKYCTEHPDFSERKETLKHNVAMRAKMNLAKKIEEGNLAESKYYLERKCKDEFGEVKESTVVVNNNPYAGLTTEELRKLVES